MATTQKFHNGNGSTKTFSFPFEYIKNTEIKVKVDSVLKTELTHYTIDNTNVVFNDNHIPPTGTNNINIYRDTDVESGAVVYAPGSSIRAFDLNKNQKQILHAIQELELVSPNSSGLVLSTGSKNDIKVNSAGNWEIIDDQVENKHLAPNAVGNTEIIDDSIAEVKLDIHNGPSTGKILRYTSNGMEWSDESTTTPSSINLTNESSDTSCFLTFSTATTGSQSLKTNTNLKFNSSSGKLTAPQFKGDLVGDVVGNVTGNVTGNITGQFNLTGPLNLPDNSTAVTQPNSDISTKIATTAYVKGHTGDVERPRGLKLGSVRPNVSTLSLYSSSLHPTSPASGAVLSVAEFGVGNSQTSNILARRGGSYISENGRNFNWGWEHSNDHGSKGYGFSNSDGYVYTPKCSQLRMPAYFMRAIAGNADDAKFLTDLNGANLGFTILKAPKIIQSYISHATSYVLTENGMLFGAGCDDHSISGNGTTSAEQVGFVPCMFWTDAGVALTGANRPKIKQFSFADCGDDFLAPGDGVRVALDTDGYVYTWGSNDYGEVGRGFTGANVPNNERHKAQRLSVTQWTHGSDTTNQPIYVYAEGSTRGSVFVITSAGKLYAWGHNTNGQLGTADTTNRLTPVCITDIASDLKTHLDANSGAKVVQVLTTGGNLTDYQRSYVLTNTGKLFACGDTDGPYTSDSNGLYLGFYDDTTTGNATNYHQTTFRECAKVHEVLTYTNEKIISLWSTGSDAPTMYVITDGGTENKPRVISWGSNATGQLGRDVTRGTTAGQSTTVLSPWNPAEIEFQNFGDSELGSATRTNETSGKMYDAVFTNKHKFGRPVAIFSDGYHQDNDSCVVLLDDLGQIYEAGTHRGYPFVAYNLNDDFNSKDEASGTDYVSRRFSPIWSQPEPIKSLAFNHVGDDLTGWTAIGVSGIVYTGGSNSYGAMGVGAPYVLGNTAAANPSHLGGFTPLAIST